MSAFLQIITRVYRRPKMLMANIKSLEAQSDPDWEQTLIVDGEGRGVGDAQAALANFSPYVSGQWIHVLDDDDCYIRPSLVAELKAIVAEHDPEVVMIRMDHGPSLGILPDDTHWQKPPQIGCIGASAFIVRRDIWKRHATAYYSSQYTSDFDFISAVFGGDPDVYWHDVIGCAVQRRSYGGTE